MNGKHPIDELFERALRDAEAAPPDTVWQGIARDRDRKRSAVGFARKRWGLMALLFVGITAAGVIAYTATEGTGRPSQYAEEVPGTSSVTLITPTTPSAPSNTSAPINAPESAGTPESSNTAASAGELPTEPSPTTPVASATPKEQADPERPSFLANAAGGQPNRTVNSGAAPTKPRESSAGSTTLSPLPNAPRGALSAGGEHGQGEGSREEGRDVRTLGDEHLNKLEMRLAPVMATQAILLPAKLSGVEGERYVIGNAAAWIALQAEFASVSGEWTGGSPLVSELNASETWRDKQGVSLWYGRAWNSGWSAGLGVGASRIRSRFLRSTYEGGSSEWQVDTTWTTNTYADVDFTTWDIEEMLITEPGIERSFNTTNSYTRLTISPEVCRTLWERRRLSVSGRFAAVFGFHAGRKGNTLVGQEHMLQNEVLSDTVVVSDLASSSFDDRTPMDVSLNIGLDIRYRLTDRFSICLLPSYGTTLASQGDLRTSRQELGGALRLWYGFPHRERKAPLLTSP